MCNVAPLWLLAGVLTFLQIGVLGILGFLTDETHAHQQTLSGLKGKVLKGKVDNSLPALTSKVDEMGTKISKIPSGMQRLTDMVSASTTKEVSALSNTEDEMCTTMQAKISSISCQMDCISGFTSSFWCATQRLEQLLTGLTQEIRANQSNFETKVISPGGPGKGDKGRQSWRPIFCLQWWLLDSGHTADRASSRNEGQWTGPI